MTNTRQAVQALLATAPHFEPAIREFWNSYATNPSPSEFFDSGDHEAYFVVRVGRLLQARFGDRLRRGGRLTQAEVDQALDDVEYERRTKLQNDIVLYLLRRHWYHGSSTPRISG
ncbi:MAG TPA: hypothetical protein VFZ48_05405 [Candidatus Saccharimonadales bacterium]